jgi:hypothetical protein
MTPDSLSERLVRFSELHANIAKDTFPKGGMLLCQSVLCSYARSFSVEQAAHYLRNGWPKHCGQQMTVQAAPKDEGQKP